MGVFDAGRIRARVKPNIVFTDEALTTVIRNYTREAGVRNLEREIGNICRKVARRVVKDKNFTIGITGENVTANIRTLKTVPEALAGTNKPHGGCICRFVQTRCIELVEEPVELEEVGCVERTT